MASVFLCFQYKVFVENRTKDWSCFLVETAKKNAVCRACFFLVGLFMCFLDHFVAEKPYKP